MKIVRYGNHGREKPGILDKNNKIRCIDHLINDIDPTNLSKINLFECFDKAFIEDFPIAAKPKHFRFGSPMAKLGRLITVEINSDTKTNINLGELGIAFACSDNAIRPVIGPHDAIIYPKNAKRFSCDVELAIIISKNCHNVLESDAMKYVLGFSCFNYISDEGSEVKENKPSPLYQSEDLKIKISNNLGSLGPYIVTPDEISNLEDLRVKFWLNGKICKNYSYIGISLPRIISQLSKNCTLYPGDVITLKNIEKNPASQVRFLKPDDKITCQIDMLGMQQQLIVSELEEPNYTFG